VLGLQVRRPFDRHATDDDVARLVDLLALEAEVLEEGEALLPAEILGCAEPIVGLFAEDPAREGAVEIEDARDGRLDLRQVGVGEPLLLQRPAGRLM
jgi:hypothetical protein